MRAWDRLVSFWDWVGRLQLVWAFIGTPVAAVIYFAWAYLHGVPLPYLVPLTGVALLTLLGIILACAGIYDRFRKRSPLEVSLDHHWLWESAENPHSWATDEDRHGQFYCVEVVNNGADTIEGVSVVYWYDGEAHHHLAYGTAKTKLSLDPNGRRRVKLFFQSYEDYAGHGETADPSPRQITVRATAKNTLSSRDLRLDFQSTGYGESDDGPIYDVSIRE